MVNNKQSGQAIIEFAFAIPIFLIVLFGTLEINRYYWTSYWLEVALHQSIEQEALEPTAGVEQRLKKYLNDTLIADENVQLTQSLERLGDLEVIQWKATYSARFNFIPRKDMTISSYSWSHANENVIR